MPVRFVPAARPPLGRIAQGGQGVGPDGVAEMFDGGPASSVRHDVRKDERNGHKIQQTF